MSKNNNNRNKIVQSDINNILKHRNISWSTFKNKTILIAGAAGFLPAYMVETLLEMNARNNADIKIIAVVRTLAKARNRFNAYRDHKNLKLLQQDVSVPFKLNQPIDYIIHAASNASPKYYGSDPVGTLTANTVGTQNLLEMAVEKKVKGFLFFSSGEIYGEVSENNIPTKERMYGYLDPTIVRSCYAESKRMGENICVSYLHQYGVPVKIVRPFHTYGPGMNLDDGRVFADLVSNVVHHEDLKLNSDGSAKRAFCYLADATIGFFTVLLKGVSGEAYNIGYPKETSIAELAETLAGMYPEKNLSVYVNAKEKESGYIVSRISRNCPDISKARQLGWEPRHSIEEGFRRTIDSFLI